jgi:hypothetical protein
MADDLTLAAENVASCPLTIPTRSDPLRLLKRLARSLWNQRPPTEPFVPELTAGDVVQDSTVFGPLGSADATPQYEIARNIVGAEDDFVSAWRRAESDQLGFGKTSVVNGAFTGQCPRAEGQDLDRWCGQFGIARPFGFGDGCYWRLFQLLMFQARHSLWRLVEIAALFTGVRPAAIEDIDLVTLAWLPPRLGGSYINVDFIGHAIITDPDYAPVSSFDAVISEDEVGVGATFIAVTDPAVSPSPGMTLEQALAFAKRRGVSVLLANAPTPGMTGCCGGAYRGPAARRGRIN